jgi:hypothetical protein
MAKRVSKKVFTFFILGILVFTNNSSFATDSYVSNSETPKGYISMAWADDVMAHSWPVSHVRSWDQNGNVRTCQSLEDSSCTYPQMDTKLLLEPCSVDSSSACIEGFSVGVSKLNLTTGSFQRMIDGVSIPASKKYETPAGGSIGIWDVPGQIHTGGTSQYSVAVALTYSLDKRGDFPATLTNFEVSVIPFKAQAGNYQKMYIGDIPGVSPSAISGMWSPGNCSWQEPDKCAKAQLWQENAIASLQIRVPNQATGWLYGRIKDPTISVSKITSSLNLLSVSGNPTLVQGKRTLVDANNIPKSLLDVITKNGAAPLPIIPAGATTGYGWVGVPPDLDYSKTWFDAWFPFTKNTADGISELWNIKAIPSSAISNPCLKSTSSFVGLVTSNSMLYSPTAPQFIDDELTYKVTSLHYLPDGVTPFKGSYDLILRSDAARCLYGFSNAPLKASIQVLGESGNNQVVTTTMAEEKGWLHLAARGFTFSSPSIRVKLAQDAATAISSETLLPTPSPSPSATAGQIKNPKPVTPVKQITITCKNGKMIKKVKAIKPICPKGYKKI